jgi:hypothetical protein
MDRGILTLRHRAPLRWRNAMPSLHFLAMGGLLVAAFAMLLVTQTRHRVAWPGWLVPAAFALVCGGWTVVAIAIDGAGAFWPVVTGSWWGIQLWHDRLMSLAAAFFLLQNRARAAGMKSEIWVLLVIFTGSIGLLLMLARTLFLERQQAAP